MRSVLQIVIAITALSHPPRAGASAKRAESDILD